MILSKAARHLTALLVVLSPALGHADAVGKYLIVSLNGEKYATIESPQGNRKAQPGMELHPGDRFRTGYRTSAELVYPDGTRIIVGRAAEITIGEIKDGIQYSDLENGEARAVVTKPAKAGATKRDLRFVIRTKCAVLGVRGTDFLFRQDGGKVRSDLYTFDGKVELAASADELLNGKVRQVGHGETAWATSKGISSAQKFDPHQLFADLSKDEPELMQQSRAESAVFREDYPEPNTKKLRWLNFQLDGVYVFQNTGGQTVTGALSWSPEWILGDRLSLRGDVGVFPLKGRTQGDTFAASDGGLLLQFNLTSQLAIDAGPGFEVWTGGHSGLGFNVMTDAIWRLHGWGMIDRLFVGFADFVSSPDGLQDGNTDPALQFKAGIGFAF